MWPHSVSHPSALPAAHRLLQHLFTGETVYKAKIICWVLCFHFNSQCIKKTCEFANGLWKCIFKARAAWLGELLQRITEGTRFARKIIPLRKSVTAERPKPSSFQENKHISASKIKLHLRYGVTLFVLWCLCASHSFGVRFDISRPNIHSILSPKEDSYCVFKAHFWTEINGDKLQEHQSQMINWDSFVHFSISLQSWSCRKNIFIALALTCRLEGTSGAGGFANSLFKQGPQTLSSLFPGHYNPHALGVL